MILADGLRLQEVALRTEISNDAISILDSRYVVEDSSELRPMHAKSEH
jgi:hypothetical protein